MVFLSGKWRAPPPVMNIGPSMQISAPEPSSIAPASISSVPEAPKKEEKEFFFDWLLLGFIFALTIVILFLFAGVMDVNLAYSIKYFFQYIVLSLTIAMLIAGIVEWLIFKKRKAGFFSFGMVICIALIMLIVSLSPFVPALLPISNAILANDAPFSKETAKMEFDSLSAYYASKAGEGEPGSALNAIYSESSSIGLLDVNFFNSQLDEVSFGFDSGEKIFALVKISQYSLLGLSSAVSKFGGIDESMTRKSLSDSLLKDSSNMDFFNGTLINSITIDSSKMGDSLPELAGKYPDSFWLEARENVVSYLAQYLAYKKDSLQSSLDSENYISAFIVAHQIEYIANNYGK